MSNVREIPDEPLHQRGDPEQPLPESLRSGKSSSESFASGHHGKITATHRFDAEFLTPPEQVNDDILDMRGTSRKEYENEYYKRICSEVLEDFLYLGSDFIAKD